MKIDKQKLIELLVNKTGMGKKEVEDQLEQLIERILDAAKKGKALEIKDFGLFYFDESGELKFDPADELSAEISFKYAGMKPIEIQPDRDTTIVPDSGDDIDVEDDIYLEKVTSTEDITEEKVDERDDFFIEHEEEKPRKPLKVEFFDELEDDEGQSVDEEFDFLSDLPAEPKTRKAGEKEKLAAAKTRSHQPRKRKQNNIVIWIIAAILLIGLIAAGLYVWLSGHSVTAPQSQQAVVTPQAQPGTQGLTDITDDLPSPGGTTVPDDSETGFDTEPVPETTVQTQSQPQTVQQTIPQDQPLYGLMGVLNQQAVNSYSIVLHSFTEEPTAVNTANQLAMEGYRVQVTTRTVANNTMWRVSVGQFETLADAQAAANTLPVPYNTQNFIHRIPNN
jgi:cell division septation protein DedD